MGSVGGDINMKTIDDLIIELKLVSASKTNNKQEVIRLLKLIKERTLMTTTTNTKPFDPTKPVQTRDGRKVRIICVDKVNTEYPIVALIKYDNYEQVICYDRNGDSGEQQLQLINIPEQPKYRAWKPEEVPVGCIMKTRDTGSRWVLIGINEQHLLKIAGDTGHRSIEYAFNNYDHSVDGGKTWLTCGVLE